MPLPVIALEQKVIQNVSSGKQSEVFKWHLRVQAKGNEGQREKIERTRYEADLEGEMAVA